MCNVYRCKNLPKEKFTNEQIMVWPQRTWLEKTIHEVETNSHSDKENVPGATVSKIGHAVSLLGHERTHHDWFPEKR